MKVFEEDNYMRSMLLLFRTERSNGPADAQHRGYQLPAGATNVRSVRSIAHNYGEHDT